MSKLFFKMYILTCINRHQFYVVLKKDGHLGSFILESSMNYNGIHACEVIDIFGNYICLQKCYSNCLEY